MTFSLRQHPLHGAARATCCSPRARDTYAPGVPIGTVTSVTPDANAISRTATIAPFVDVTALDLVGRHHATPSAPHPREPLRPVAPGPEPDLDAVRRGRPAGPGPDATPRRRDAGPGDPDGRALATPTP